MDPGLQGVRGELTAVAWTQAELAANPCRRGMLRPSGNDAFEYADGTPFFLLGDTWWATPTFRFRWYQDDTPRPLGPSAGFKDYVRYRRSQQFNCIAMIAAFPNWANDGKPARWKTKDGMILRSAWPQAGTGSAKEMTDEQGRRPFHFPGAVPGHAAIFSRPQPHPAGVLSFSRQEGRLSERPGNDPFHRSGSPRHRAGMETILSVAGVVHPVHPIRLEPLPGKHLPVQSDPFRHAGAEHRRSRTGTRRRIWSSTQFGHPPFGTLAGTNSNPSSLRNWGHTDRARWLGFHQIGNRRTHDVYEYLTETFQARPPVPGINGEPYYDGMEDAEPGSDKAARYCRSAMYGSVLSGGLGGHIYGAGG